MENKIKQVIRDYKSQLLLENRKVMSVRKDESIIKSANEVLKMMNKAEKEVLAKYQPTINKLRLYSVHTKPVAYGVSSYNINRMNIKNNLLKIVSAHSSCGDSWYSSVKIPLEYFEMSEEKIYEAHVKWSENHLSSEIHKAKKNLKARKIKEVAKLQEEIKELSA